MKAKFAIFVVIAIVIYQMGSWATNHFQERMYELQKEVDTLDRKLNLLRSSLRIYSKYSGYSVAVYPLYTTANIIQQWANSLQLLTGSKVSLTFQAAREKGLERVATPIDFIKTKSVYEYPFKATVMVSKRHLTGRTYLQIMRTMYGYRLVFYPESIEIKFGNVLLSLRAVGGRQ